MANVTPRRMLIFKIQKKLPELTASQLQKIASTIDDGQEMYNVDELSEPELFDLIIDYIKSETLKAMEDEGLAQLLHLHDLLHELPLVSDSGAAEVDNAAPQLMKEALSYRHDHIPSTSKDGNIHTHTMDRDTHEPATDVTTLMPNKSSFANSCGAHLDQLSSSSTRTD